MRAKIQILFLLLYSLSLWSNTSTFSWYTKDANNQVILNIELFLSSTCPHCHKEDAFFREIEPKTPWIKVQRNIINKDKKALKRFNQFLTQLKPNQIDFSVPSAFFCNTRWVGFDTTQTSGKDLLKALQYCKTQIEQKGALTEPTINVIKRWANANFFNSGIVEQPSTLHYFLIVALFDMLNPCSLFCFAGFLAILFIQQSRRNQVISGLLYIGAIALIHFTQQTQANIFFQILPWLRGAAIIIGISSLYIATRYYKNQVIKPRLFFIWTFLLAFIVQSYQQTCMMNWSYIFEQWLYNQPWSLGQKTILQLLYQGVYILPLLILLLIFTNLHRLKFFPAVQPKLKIIGLALISLTAVFLIVYPMIFSYYWPSLVLILMTAVGGSFLGYRKI